MPHPLSRRRGALLLAATLLGACNGRLDVAAPAPGANLYEPVSPASAAGKVKNLLTGLPPTPAELAAVKADPGALRGLVQQWMATPQSQAKLLAFFATAFQQSQVTADEFTDQIGPNVVSRLDNLLLANLRESFARTVLQLAQDGQPFTAALTTRKFMLTPRLMAMYAFIDALQMDDRGRTVDAFARAHPGLTFKVTAKAGPIPLTQTLDPASPNYLTFFAPQLAAAYDPLCPQDPIVYSGGAGQLSLSTELYLVLQGSLPQFTIQTANGPHTCRPPGTPAAAVPFVLSDTQGWQLVSIRPPAPGEATASLLDLLAFRSGAHELVLNVPRVGFFTTPAFLAGWNTNPSNQARVTINQTLIVALNHAVSPTNAALPPSIAAVDAVHAPQGTACFACHQTLDPMRQFFRHDYSLSFHNQADATQLALSPSFGFRGVTGTGSSVFDLAGLLAGHPDFANAWTQKLCTYANSAACLETDPEFQRIAAAFTASNYSWNTLMLEMFSSPLVSNLGSTQTAQQTGQTFPIARRDHLCAALSSRLGIADLCGLDPNTKVPKALQPVQLIASVLPSDQYSRGSEQPVLAADPNLSFRVGMENVCAAAAGLTIDAGPGSRWTSSQSDPAITDFVHGLMGVLPPDDATPLSILVGHYRAAQAAGLTPSDALRSTFVLACLSPNVIGIGL